MKSMILLLGMIGVSFFAFAKPIQIHGHRGARAIEAENSLTSFRYALENKVDVIEMDLSLTKDDVLVVYHDEALNPNLCLYQDGKLIPQDIAIRSLKAEQLKNVRCGVIKNMDFKNQKISVLGEPIPTLDEALDFIVKHDKLAPYEYKLNIEIKVRKDLAPGQTDLSIRKLVESVQKHKLFERTILQSFDLKTVARAKELFPGLTTAFLVAGRDRYYKKFIGANSYLRLVREAKAGILSPHFDVISKSEIKELQSHGIQVIVWTVNEPKDWQRMINYGVDGIITDDPVGLKNFLNLRK